MMRLITWLYGLALLLAGFGVLYLLGRGLEFSRRTAPVMEPAPAATGASVNVPAATGKNFVFWISLDGFRGDYLDKAKCPGIRQLSAAGVYSKNLQPPFPSLTFPSHVTQATGVLVDGHGIPSNEFFDSQTRQLHNFPGDANLLRAEPIWQTATRQGVRVQVRDWPLSQGMQPNRPLLNEEKFDAAISDQDRLVRLLNGWKKEAAPGDLRLIMGYAKAVDQAGHKLGPEAIETLDAVAATDTMIGQLHAAAVLQFQSVAKKEDQFYFILTADHGMTVVQQNVNLKGIVGLEAANLNLVTSGPLAMVSAKPEAPLPMQETALAALDKAFQDKPWGKVYTPETLPAQWHFSDPTRLGQRIVVLEKGYTFHGSAIGQTAAPNNSQNRGMHGYDPAIVPEMGGLFLIWRFPQPFKSPRDLGTVSSLALHPTVCKILGIQPAAGATAPALALGD